MSQPAPWKLTAGLVGALALAAWLVPTLQGEARTADPRTGDLAVGQAGDLSFSARLDQDVLLVGGGEDRFLVVEVTAPARPDDARQPVHLSVVMDTSGSMWGEGKIENARAAASSIVGQLGSEDTFSLVTFDSTASVVWATSHVYSGDQIRQRIFSIRPDGGTNLGAGLASGLGQLSDVREPGVHRLVLLSDGLANIGETSMSGLAALAGRGPSKGISVSAIGLGHDFDENVLTAVSDAGGGRYRYVNNASELAPLFADELNQASRVAGRMVEVDVDLAEGVELLDVYGYEENDGGRTATGFRALLGDVHGGETRKVVARVRVPDRHASKVDVADVQARWRASGGSADRWQAHVLARVSPDARVAAASVNPSVGVQAARAIAGVALDRSNRSWAEGSTAAADKLARSASDTLDAMARRYGAPEVAAQAASMRKQARAYDAMDARTVEGVEFRMRNQLEALGYVE